MTAPSVELKEAAWAPASRLPLVCIEIAHADLTTPIRVVNNTKDVTVDGVIYTAFPFDILLPDSLEDAPPRAKLRIDNVDQSIGQAVRSITTPATVTVKVVRVVDPVVDNLIAAPGFLPAGYALTRASSGHDGTFIDSAGLMQNAVASAARWTYDHLTMLVRGLLNEPARTNLITTSDQAYNSANGWFGSAPAVLTNDFSTLLGIDANRAVNSAPAIDGLCAGVLLISLSNNLRS